ncbi:MAG: hypothetical protein J6N49_01735 [Alphaproteobacteria bacterium]|nr:hypothetical protein [Alphaproteobacteria bacterium]
MIWGLKTEAAFDVWSVEHLVMGVSVGWFSMYLANKIIGDEKISDKLKLRISFIITLLVAYMWETLEHYLEVGLAGHAVEYWLQGVEHWSNRLIFDNLMVMSGWWIYQQQNKMVWFARVFSVIWLFVHIVIFPHSMYLHQFF